MSTFVVLCVHKVPQSIIKRVREMFKDDLLKVRMTKEEKDKIRYFARRRGLNMSEYIKHCIMKTEALEKENSSNEKEK